MTRRAIILLGLIVALVAMAWFGVSQWQSARNAGTVAKLAKGQQGAAIESGADAVGTLGNRMAEDAGQIRTIEETKDEIDRARDAGAVTDAGRNGLCRLRGNRHRPECVQQRAAP